MDDKTIKKALIGIAALGFYMFSSFLFEVLNIIENGRKVVDWIGLAVGFFLFFILMSIDHKSKILHVVFLLLLAIAITGAVDILIGTNFPTIVPIQSKEEIARGILILFVFLIGGLFGKYYGKNVVET